MIPRSIGRVLVHIVLQETVLAQRAGDRELKFKAMRCADRKREAGHKRGKTGHDYGLTEHRRKIMLAGITVCHSLALVLRELQMQIGEGQYGNS